ncbi:adenylate/guanylate cyclase domain-containing protein [Treponema sp.]|uniref:adenylate/guanylate cyclase domain-containing protein n=1 Tax=Treponema sp. TaxID=166 RepID=UPI00298DD5F6|nr:adenylate/guanylate cyclase domain-containing protein [Treponema sp.]MCR5613946.1 adenylate/guanylate cyclase domain-containing protein [Treponema sp.]
MNYNIEFQIAGIIVVAVLMIVFYSKKRWPSGANLVYRFIMGFVFFELALDIASVITITKYIAGDDEIQLLNDVLSKSYLIAMLGFILTMDIYAIVNTATKPISQARLTLKYVEAVIWGIIFIVACVFILSNPLLYGGQGKMIYSYGIPSDTVYVVSTLSVIFVILILLFNCRRVKFKRLVPIIAFSVMEGLIAIIQMFNKQLLLVGLGSAICCLITYFALENPDMNMIDELNKANMRARNLLLNILPLTIADKLENESQSFYEEFDDVTIMFIDIVSFTKMAAEVGGTKLVKVLNALFSEIDDLLSGFRIEKIKTIGDAYMVAAGCPDRYEGNCEEMLKFARQVLRLVSDFNRRYNVNLHIRIGVNNGRVVAGVIGKKKFVYDLWGDAVNLASRLESNGVSDRINVSERVRFILGDQYKYETIGPVEMKGLGKVHSYLIV